jgi:hypothetical protein
MEYPRNAPSQILIDHGPPWDQAETDSVVEHGKASADKPDIPSVNTRDSFAVDDRPMHESRLFRNAQGGYLDVSVAQGRKQIAS